jgi:hypothetical protein
MAEAAIKVARRLSHACRANKGWRETSFFDKRLGPMLAYSSEIGAEIAQSPDAVHYAQLFGIVTTSKMQSSATSAAFARCAHPTQSGTTHTDPQILFSVMRS